MASPRTKTQKAPTPQFYITWNVITFPVTSDPASRDAKSTIQNMHRQCAKAGTAAGLSQQKVCSACSAVVPTEDQVSVHIGENGRLAVLTKEQINALRPEADKTMTVEAMVALAQVPLIQLKGANYLGPTERTGSKGFELMRRAMLALDRVALVTYTSYQKERVGIIRPTPEGLILHECYYDDEVRDYERLEMPPVEIKDVELALAKELVSISEAEFDLAPYTNGFRQRLDATITRLLSGEAAPPVEPAAPRAEVIDMMAALQASLAAVRKGPAKAAAPGAASDGQTKTKRAAA